MVDTNTPLQDQASFYLSPNLFEKSFCDKIINLKFNGDVKFNLDYRRKRYTEMLSLKLALLTMCSEVVFTGCS